MNIEKLKECAELWEKYKKLNSELVEVLQRIENLEEDTPDVSEDQLVMGSPVHRKLEAMLHEFNISRDVFKDYFGLSSMKYVTHGMAKKFFDNPDVYVDAINGRNR